MNIPIYAVSNRVKLFEKNRTALVMSETSPLNRTEGSGNVGVITSSVAYCYVKECPENVSILKFGFNNPVPEKKIADFVRGKKIVIVAKSSNHTWRTRCRGSVIAGFEEYLKIDDLVRSIISANFHVSTISTTRTAGKMVAANAIMIGPSRPWMASR